MPAILRDLVNLFGFEHLEDPTGYSIAFEGRTLFWCLRDSILWCGHSLWSHTDAWVMYMDMGIDFDDPTRLFLVLEFMHHPGQADEHIPHLSACMASTPADWAAVKDGLIRPWIERGRQVESDDDASGQDTDTSL